MPGDGASLDDELHRLVWSKLNDPAVIESLSVEQLKQIVAVFEGVMERKRRDDGRPD